MNIKFEPIKRNTLTVSETAKYLGVSTDLIYLLVREGKIIHFRLGRRILFKKEEIDKWVQSQMVGGLDDEQ
ncbi:helix-turn-helix domain-containing protein [Virgibacillus proomii]|uniref:helix-turn-helix domain-containing protein n=1 Tax=Virgibacillus proomii TaxID=84407 RepID=UPI003182CC08